MSRPEPVALAVLGDSDSQSYHDQVLLGSGDDKPRGGAYHAVTYQWTEVLSRLRPLAIDLGPWGTWGDGLWTRRLKKLAGLRTWGPSKQDYRYNFAMTGATCGPRNKDLGAQAGALLDEMNASPARWTKGIVLVRIGINNFGTRDPMTRSAAVGLDSVAAADVRTCVDDVRRVVTLLRAKHPSTGVVLAGILDNADWPRWHELWQSRTELDNIAEVLDAFDQGLRGIANSYPQVVFFDDRAWFRSVWGSRDAAGRPAYRTVSLGGPQSVTMTEGDRPNNAVLADGHAGTVWNGLWAQALARTLNQSFGLEIPDIRLEEISGLADPNGDTGLKGR